MVNRRELAQYFNKLNFRTGAEIGTEEGRYSKILCEEIPGVKLFCVDLWERDPTHDPTPYEIAKKTLEPYDCKLIKGYSMDVVKEFDDGSLDFVYIDANHYFDYVMEDIIHWSRKVRKGGIVSGHDYFVTKKKESSLSVVEAVDAYAKFYNLEVNVIPRDETAFRYSDKKPNWWWWKI